MALVNGLCLRGAYSECDLSSRLLFMNAEACKNAALSKGLCKIDCIYCKAQTPSLRVQAVGFDSIKFISRILQLGSPSPGIFL